MKRLKQALQHWFARSPTDRAKRLLQPIMPGEYSVEYWPAFPRADKSTFRWFQVVLQIGAGNKNELRATVHRTIAEALPLLAGLRQVRKADVVSIRVRRHMPELAERPVMFIEVFWPGTAVQTMHDSGNFASWWQSCTQYLNRLDDDDPLNKSLWEPSS